MLLSYYLVITMIITDILGCSKNFAFEGNLKKNVVNYRRRLTSSPGTPKLCPRETTLFIIPISYAPMAGAKLLRWGVLITLLRNEISDVYA